MTRPAGADRRAELASLPKFRLILMCRAAGIYAVAAPLETWPKDDLINALLAEPPEVSR